MKYVENGVPEDAAKLTFAGLSVPLCELSDEEYLWIVYGVRKTIEGATVVQGAQTGKKDRYDNEPIDILELSVRAEHCLERAGIETIGQLCAMTEAELGRLRNMGAKSVKEVKAKLEKLGCKLREEEL